MKTPLISAMLLVVILCGNASAQTLIEKEERGMNLTSVELVAIFMAEIAACEARDAEFKRQVTTPLSQLKRSKRFLDIERSPNFQKISADAGVFVQKKGGGNCRITLESLKQELKNFQ